MNQQQPQSNQHSQQQHSQPPHHSQLSPQTLNRPDINKPLPVATTALDFALKPLQQLQQPPAPNGTQFDQQDIHNYERTMVKIILCDHEFCPNLPQLYLDTLHQGARLFFPEENKQFEQCQTTYLKEDERKQHCLPLFDPIIAKTMPIIERHLQFRRERYSKDPLESYYDPLQYGDPIWFYGALNIWRRKAGGSKTVSIRDCEPLIEQYQQCMIDNDDDYTKCFMPHFNSSICEPGYNCPSLQPDILRCASNNNDDTKETLENCFRKLDKFLPCAVGQHIEPIQQRHTVQGSAI